MDAVAESRPAPRTAWIAVAAIVALALGALFLIGFLPRHRRARELSAAAAAIATAPPRVRTAHPTPTPATQTLTLPGTIEAERETVLYARASGYVRRWLVDLGQAVKAGDLLAEIDAPELTQQLAQARGALAEARAAQAQAQAALGLALVNLQRVEKLADITSQQDIDTRRAERDQAQANVGVAEAKVQADEADARRLEEMVGFCRVLAPFDGVVTERAIEVGNLVNGGAQPLYRIAQVDPVRIVVEAPQPLAPSVAVGQSASVVQGGGASATGRVAHIARALSATSRTMRVEVEVPNGDGRLMPGMYAQVSLELPTAQAMVTIDSAALITGADGNRVAIVDEASRVRFRPVVIGVDNGAEVAISAGLAATDRVVVNPTGRLVEGEAVEVAEDVEQR